MKTTTNTDNSVPFRKRLVVEGFHKNDLEISQQVVCDFYHELSKTLGMTIVHGPCVGYWAEEYKPDVYTGNEAYVIWAESGSQFYWWRTKKFFTVDIYTCNDFDVEDAISMVSKYFGNNFQYNLVPEIFEQYPNHLEVKTNEKGKGLYAKTDIQKGESVFIINGSMYFSESESVLNRYGRTKHIRDYAIPISEYYYVDQSGNAPLMFLNHSCDPNCAVRDLLEIYSVRDIEQGEELTISYSTICDSDWENPEGVCLCGSENCNGKILPWRELSKEQQKYFLENNMVTDWILMKYLKKEKVDFAKLMGL